MLPVYKAGSIFETYFTTGGTSFAITTAGSGAIKSKICLTTGTWSTCANTQSFLSPVKIVPAIERNSGFLERPKTYSAIAPTQNTTITQWATGNPKIVNVALNQASIL
jgi:hypothetical protein